MNTGIFGEGFPYSNFHDLNMDWIIKIAKDFLDQYTHIQETIANGETALTDLTNESLESLQDKADTLEGLLQAWYDTHSADIAGELADALEDIQTELATAISTFNTSAEQKAQQTIASIPSDYTALSNLVTFLYGATSSMRVVEKENDTVAGDVSTFFLDAEIGEGVTDVLIKSIYKNFSPPNIQINFKLNGTQITAWGVNSQNGASGFECIKDDYVSFLVNWDAISENKESVNLTLTSPYGKDHVGLIDLIEYYKNPTYNLNGDVVSVISGTNNWKVHQFFLDATPRSDLSDIVITQIYYSSEYHFVRANFTLDGNTITNYTIDSRNGGVGIEYIPDEYIPIIVNWNMLTATVGSLSLSFTPTYLNDHVGLIYLLTHKADNPDWQQFDQFYVKDGYLLANSNYIRTRTCAKYYSVDIGSKVKKIMCKFKCKSQYGTVMLITTNYHDQGHIGDITEKRSNHSGFTPYGYMHFATYGAEEPNPQNIQVPFNTPLVEDQIYELGYEFLGNDEIKVYLPDGTNTTITLTGIDDCNGRYFIMEYFWDGFPVGYETIRNDWTPQIMGIFVEGESGYYYQDNFKRPLSELSVSPSGHVYTSFRNTTPNDTLYDVTDGKDMTP